MTNVRYSASRNQSIIHVEPPTTSTLTGSCPGGRISHNRFHHPPPSFRSHGFPFFATQQVRKAQHSKSSITVAIKTVVAKWSASLLVRPACEANEASHAGRTIKEALHFAKTVLMATVMPDLLCTAFPPVEWQRKETYTDGKKAGGGGNDYEMCVPHNNCS